MAKIKLSKMPKTWLLDVDGVVFVHNSHLSEGDRLVEGVKAFIDALPMQDMIILLTARTEEHRPATEASLKKHGIRYDAILFNLPMGERVLVNDSKPANADFPEMITSIAISTHRDVCDIPSIEYN